MKRLFFALWPDEAVRAQLASAGAPLRTVAGRWVSDNNLHLTLVFLGDVDARGQDCARQAASGVAGRRFELVLDALGYWRRANILWLGPSRTPAELLFLVDTLRANLANCGFTLEGRAYRAHITLARKLQLYNKRFAGSATAPVYWPIDRFVLMASGQEREGVRYEVLASWDLSNS